MLICAAGGKSGRGELLLPEKERAQTHLGPNAAGFVSAAYAGCFVFGFLMLACLASSSSLLA